MNIGERIRQLRTEKNMSQDKLAEAAGITKSSISNYEQNIRSPQYSALYAIANALDVPLNELTSYTLNGTDYEVSNTISKEEIDDKRPRRVRRLLDAFNKLSDKAQMKALERIEELTLIPKYQMSLSESLKRYIYNTYLLSYEPYEDTQEETTYEKSDLNFGDSCLVNIRHITLKREVKKEVQKETCYWHFIYYHFEKVEHPHPNIGEQCPLKNGIIYDILYDNENDANCHDRYSYIFDNETIFDKFFSLYGDDRANSDVDNLSYGNDNRPKFTFFLINKETLEVRLEDETD